MGYIDKAFYDNTYKGTPMDADTFSKLESRASHIVDMVTGFQLIGVDLSEKPEFIQTNIKYAVAAQVEYMDSEGGELSVHGGSPSSVSVGGFSYSEDPGAKTVRVMSDSAYSYLIGTGLLYGGVNVR